MPVLPWPNGDQTSIRRWRLSVRVTGLSKEWPIELRLQWMLGAKTFELTQYSALEDAKSGTERAKSPREQPMVADGPIGDSSLLSEDSNGANPYPLDDPLHQVWEGLPREAREALSRLSLECRGEVLEFDKVFQEKFAETASLDLLEKYCLGRFDLCADQLLIVSNSADPTSLNPQYQSYLDILQQKGRAFLTNALRTMRFDVREEIISRIALKLSSRKLHWLREAINWRLRGCPPRSPSSVNRYFEAEPTDGTGTSSSLDDYIRRLANELERKGSTSEPTSPTPRTPAELAPDEPAEPARSRSGLAAARNRDSAQPPDDENCLNFGSEAGRKNSLTTYTMRWTTDSWTCTEASLARTARVDPADLSKWKKGLLPAGSEKKRRIEDTLKNNERPTPPSKRRSDT
jgi:hypothetical protein